MNFAVIEDGIVTNVILADSKAFAEELTGKICVKYTEGDDVYNGGTYDGVNFIAPQPFPSWILNSENVWESPVAYPIDGDPYFWNEETTSWVKVVVEPTE
jgi:hypothetical protein